MAGSAELIDERTVSVERSGGSNGQSQSATLSNGNIVVVYRSNAPDGPGSAPGKDILGQIYDPLGRPVGETFLVNTGYAQDSEEAPAIAALDDGAFVVVYEDHRNGNSSIRATEWRTDADGVTSSSSRSIASANVNTDYVDPSVTARADGGYTVSYTAGSDGGTSVFLRTVDGNGASRTPIDAHPLTGLSLHQDNAEIATLRDGTTVAVFEDTTLFGTSITAAIYDEDGHPLRTIQNIGGSQFNGVNDKEPTVEATAFGFVIAWERDDGRNDDIRVVAFSQGGAVRGETTISDGSSDNKNEAEIVALGDGFAFAVLFDDEVRSTIDGQIFSARDRGPLDEVGERFTLSEAGSEFAPSATLLADGRVATSFTSTEGLGTNVFLDIFDPRDSGEHFARSADEGTFVGTDGNDTLYDERGGETRLFGGDGNDAIFANRLGGGGHYDGGAGFDTLNLSRLEEGTVIDTDAGTITKGTVATFVSIERIIATDRNDLVTSGARTVSVDLAGGNDTFTGGSADDRVSGGDGFDILSGGKGRDRLFGDGSFDDLFGGEGDDRLYGGDGRDSLFGEAGADRLNGEADEDTLDGGAGDDELIGGGGDDVLFGGTGDDTLFGELGTDSLTGGEGSDTFALSPRRFLEGESGFGRTGTVLEITDFTVGEDVLNFVSYLPGELEHERSGDDHIVRIDGDLAIVIVEGYYLQEGPPLDRIISFDLL